ncbi:MAG: ubiquitin-conjugating enzyme E2 [Thermodesulfobacteriota bacterium]
MSIRLKRLYADFQRVSQLFREYSNISIKNIFGKPPEKYQIEYSIKGIRQEAEKIVEQDTHLVEIVLPRNYPGESPICRMLSPIFHPNIAPHVICITDHWTAGESLADLIIRIGEMICYQSYNIKSPLNGEAAKWADRNIDRLPLDTVDLSLHKRPEDIVVNIEEFESVDENVPKEEEMIDNSSNKSILGSRLNDVAELPQPTEQEVTKKTNEEICSNCGAKGENAQFEECVNGHFICSDCIIECQICGRTLCVLCSFSKCPSCQRLVCKEHYSEVANLCLECSTLK